MTTALILAKENRIMLEAVKTDITEIKASIKLISNHYSKRLPLWASILFTIFGALITGLIVGGVK